MAALLGSTVFPGGVAHPATGRAYVHDSSGSIVALDLQNGTVLWRSDPGLRPLAVVGDRVVALKIAGPGAGAVVILAAKDGATLGQSSPLGLPAWAHLSLVDTAAMRLVAEVDGRGVVLHWSARSLYAGGAPPPSAAPAKGPAEGAVRVDVDDCRLETLPAVPSRSRAVTAKSSPDPALLAESELGGRRFRQVTRTTGGRNEVLIEALDPATGAVHWQTVIESGPPARPRPLRP